MQSGSRATIEQATLSNSDASGLPRRAPTVVDLHRIEHLNHTLRWLLWGCLIVSLLACEAASTGPALLDTYLSRLERATETDRPPPPLERPPRLSEARLATLPINNATISVLEFLALTGCELQVNIGRRNSALGRNASSSQALLLDVEFLHHAPRCVTTLEAKGNESLANTLRSLAEERKSTLPTRIFNALFAGPEFSELWRFPPQLGDYPVDVGSDVVASLDYFDAVIRQWLSGDYSANFANHNAQFEGHLAQLRAGDGGALLLATATLKRLLHQASLLLTDANASDALCPQGRVTRRAEIAQNVVAKFFTADIQPWLARIHSRRHNFMAPILSVEQQLAPVLPENYLAWQVRRDALLAATGEAPRDHILAIKSAFSDCASSPWSY